MKAESLEHFTLYCHRYFLRCFPAAHEKRLRPGSSRHQGLYPHREPKVRVSVIWIPKRNPLRKVGELSLFPPEPSDGPVARAAAIRYSSDPGH